MGSFSTWYNGMKESFVPFDRFWKIGSSLTHNSISDEEAIKKAYLGSAVVYTIINRIATAVSTLPVELYDKRTGETIESGDAWDFVFKPNEQQGFNEFWEQLVTYYAITGECYNYENQDIIGFQGRQIVLPPQMVTIVTENNSILSPVKYYQFNDAEKSMNLLPEFVMHVAKNNPSVEGLRTKNGLSPVQAAQNIINASTNIEVALSEYFENRGVSALVSGSNDAGMSMTPQDQTFLQKALNRVLGGARKSNSVHVVKSPVTVQQLNASSTDMQTIENKEQLIRELCAVWGLPVVLVNDTSSATYNNVKEAKKEAYSELYIPTFYKIASAYERKFLNRFGEVGLRVDKHKIEALNESPTERRKQAREDVKAGILTPNEARLEQGLETLEQPQMDIAISQNGARQQQTEGE